MSEEIVNEYFDTYAAMPGEIQKEAETLRDRLAEEFKRYWKIAAGITAIMFLIHWVRNR